MFPKPIGFFFHSFFILLSFANSLFPFFRGEFSAGHYPISVGILSSHASVAGSSLSTDRPHSINGMISVEF